MYLCSNLGHHGVVELIEVDQKPVIDEIPVPDTSPPYEPGTIFLPKLVKVYFKKGGKRRCNVIFDLETQNQFGDSVVNSYSLEEKVREKIFDKKIREKHLKKEFDEVKSIQSPVLSEVYKVSCTQRIETDRRLGDCNCKATSFIRVLKTRDLKDPVYLSLENWLVLTNSQALHHNCFVEPGLKKSVEKTRKIISVNREFSHSQTSTFGRTITTPTFTTLFYGTCRRVRFRDYFSDSQKINAKFTLICDQDDSCKFSMVVRALRTKSFKDKIFYDLRNWMAIEENFDKKPEAYLHSCKVQTSSSYSEGSQVSRDQNHSVKILHQPIVLRKILPRK